MRTVTLLQNAISQLVSLSALMGRSLFLCGLLLISVMVQLVVSCNTHYVNSYMGHVYFMHVDTSPTSSLYVLIASLKPSTYTLIPLPHCSSAAPEDYSSAMSYNVTFNQTAFFDHLTPPRPFAVSSPIRIYIVNNNIFEGVEYFQARIVQTSDVFRVRIGPQNAVNVTITDSKSYYIV